MAQLLNEASEAGNVVLWLSAFHRYLAVDEPALADLLKDRLSQDGLAVITSTDETGYTEHIKPDENCHDLFHVTWIHDLSAPLKL